MQSRQITKAEQGQRLNKYLGRVLKEAPQSFLYKMLRKKNITLNGSRADGSELLKAGDSVCFFLSDETFSKFSGEKSESKSLHFAQKAIEKRSIRFENDELLIAYKPAGLLSQKDKSGMESINEQILQYLLEEGKITRESLNSFKPSICNRLDRNTSGLILFAKTLAAQQEIGRCLQERTIKKYYLCVVIGRLTEPFVHQGYLCKNPKTNHVYITSDKTLPDAAPIETSGKPLAVHNNLTLVRVELHTGKSHQIRGVMESMGHPILGDPKYLGEDAQTVRIMREFNQKYGLVSQQLLAYELRFPDMSGGLAELSQKRFFSPLPGTFHRVLTEEFPKTALAGNEKVLR